MRYISTEGWQTPEEARELKRNGISYRQQAAKLGVSHEKFRRYLRKPRRPEGLDPRETLIVANRTFEEALRDAIQLGLERAPIGVHKDRTPHPIGRVMHAFLHSGYRSPAAACCD